MSIADDIKRLDLKLDDMDWEEVDRITAQVKRDKEDPIIQYTMTELLIEEYLSVVKPEVMEALTKERQKETDELRQTLVRQFDDKGNKICDESLCTSIEGVVKCTYCDKHVCKDHTYGPDVPCCYACFKEHFGSSRTS